MQLNRVFDILSFQENRHPSAKAIVHRRNDQWHAFSITTIREKVDQYTHLLLNLGVRKGDFVLLMPELTTLEWLLFDFAIQQIGAVDIPIHVSFHKQQFDYILEETEAKYCILPNTACKHRLFPNGISKELQLIILETSDTNDAHSLHHLVEKITDTNHDLAAHQEAVLPEDLATIIYTSGTTGLPKGVMLTHKNLMSNLHATMPLLPVKQNKRVLSFLPWSHIFERSVLYTYIAMGCQVYLLEDRQYLSDAFKEVKPHLFTCVPRILEKIYAAILVYQEAQNPLVRKTISWALNIAMRYQSHRSIKPLYWVQYQVAKFLWYNAINRVFGGSLEAIFVGAAYLQPQLARIFSASGIKVREGYGMTETSPAITVNRFTPGLNQFGTVGIPVPGMEVKIEHPDEDGDGEILVRGENVMKGYYKKPAATTAVLSADGWLRTGDVGRWVNRRFLKITDRKKAIFKTSSGKYIAPQALEKHFSSSPFIDQIMVVGFKRPYIIALILPNFILLHKWASEQKIHWTSPQYMAINIKIRQKIQDEITKLNETLASHQKIRGFHLLHKELTIEEGQLSYTMKLIRPTIEKQFQKEITALYQS